MIGPQIAQVRAGKGATWHENQLIPITRDGGLEDVYWTYSYSPIDDDTSVGKIGGVLVIATETTEQVLTTQRLAAERAEQQRLLQQMPGFVGVLRGPEHVYSYVNDSYVAISGPRDFIGRGVREVFPELAGQGFFELLDQVYASGERFSARALPIRLEGEARERYIDMLYEPTRDDAGRVDGIFVGGYDVTERVRAEAELRTSERRFRTAINAVQGILWTNTPEGLMDDDQPGWSALTGQTSEHYVGLGWVEAVHPDDVADTVTAWNAAVGARSIFVHEHRVKRHDGIWRTFSVRAVPMLDETGAVTQWVGVHTDITEQRTAEQALRILTATQEDRIKLAVIERADAMARLHEAQKIDTLGQLTGGVAHDFNNLLTPIMGGIDLLSRRLADDDRAQRIASGAMQSAERAKTLVQRLLSFGRRQILESRAVDLAQLVDGMRDLIGRSLGPTIELAIYVPPTLPAVEVDPNQLELALLNLSVNARDAMENGGTLTIEARRLVDQERELITLSVRDTGRGMDADTLARAAEPFFTTKGVGQGTGLGLSMVHGLAAQSGGSLVLTSVLGEGTTAALSLPVAEGRAEAAPHSPAALDVASGTGTLLIVDDEELVRMSVAEGLRNLGYDVVEAASAAGALERLREGLRPDLLVTDHLMPGMTGVALAREARARLSDLPVLMITGYANLRQDETRGIEILAKPFQLHDLARRVADLLERNRQDNVIEIGRAARSVDHQGKRRS